MSSSQTRKRSRSPSSDSQSGPSKRRLVSERGLPGSSNAPSFRSGQHPNKSPTRANLAELSPSKDSTTGREAPLIDALSATASYQNRLQTTPYKIASNNEVANKDPLTPPRPSTRLVITIPSRKARMSEQARTQQNAKRPSPSSTPELELQDPAATPSRSNSTAASIQSPPPQTEGDRIGEIIDDDPNASSFPSCPTPPYMGSNAELASASLDEDLSIEKARFSPVAPSKKRGQKPEAVWVFSKYPRGETPVRDLLYPEFKEEEPKPPVLIKKSVEFTVLDMEDEDLDSGEDGKERKKDIAIPLSMSVSKANDGRWICLWNNCGKDFARNDHLSRHVNNYHLQLRNSRCEICAIAFRKSKTLQHHKNTQHPNARIVDGVIKKDPKSVNTTVTETEAPKTRSSRF